MRHLGYFVAVAILGFGASTRAQDAAPEGEPKKEEAATATGETQPAFEQISAAPAATTTEETKVTTTATTSEGEEAKKKPFSLSVSVEHGIGTGNFVENGYLRETSEYFGQSWSLAPAYNFDALGHRLSASVRLGFEQEFTQPDTNPARNFKPSDIRLGLNDGKLYDWELTGISFNGGVRLTLPTSYESLNVRKLRLGTGLSMGASRSFGPVDLSYGLSLSKSFHGSPMVTRTTELARGGEASSRPGGINDPTEIAMGGANTSWSISNTVGVSWNINDKMSVGYSLAINNGFKYDLTDEQRQFLTSNLADEGGGYTNSLAPSIEASYDATDLVKQVGDVPFSVGLAAGIAASHPIYGYGTVVDQGRVLQDGDKEFIWPVLWPVFTNNRAAANYGSIYFNISARY